MKYFLTDWDQQEEEQTLHLSIEQQNKIDEALRKFVL